MGFEFDLAVRAIHVISASLWFGAAVFLAFIMGPHLRAAGSAAGPFMNVALRRGGFSHFFVAAGTVAILAGGYTLHSAGYDNDLFGSADHIVLFVGVLFALAAYVDGLVVLLPNERRMKALARRMPPGPPSPADAQAMAAMAQKQGKGSAIGGMLVVVAMLCMTLHGLF